MVVEPEVYAYPHKTQSQFTYPLQTKTFIKPPELESILTIARRNSNSKLAI